MKRSVTISLAVLLGCSAPGPDIDPSEHDTYLVFDYDADSEEYRLHPAKIHTLRDPHSVSGDVGFVRGGGQLVTVNAEPLTEEEFEQSIAIEDDREPSAEYTIEDGVVVPYDFDSQMMVTLYHHVERANDYFDSLGFDTDRIGRLPIYYYPQTSVLGVSLPLFSDNAAYAFTLDAFLIPPRLVLQDDVPLSANRGVIVHEYSHAVFNRIVHDDDRSPDFIISGEYTLAVQNQIRSLDEGLADLFAALALQQPDFIASSISAELFDIDRDLSRERIWDEELQTRVAASSGPAGLNPYLYGSLVASTLWATRPIFDDDEMLGRVTLDAMELVKNPPSTFHLTDFFNAFLESSPVEHREAVCEVFTKRLQLVEEQLDC